jgi:hypothetical protein
MPYEPDPGPDAAADQRLAFGRNREVRRAMSNLIATHLVINARVSWQGNNFDFTGTRFDGGDFTGVDFVGGSPSTAGSPLPATNGRRATVRHYVFRPPRSGTACGRLGR